MTSFNQTVMEFNSLMQQQRFLEAIDKFYSPDIISEDNDNKPTVGIDNLRAAVKHFTEHARVHKIEVVSLLIEKDLSVTNWYYAFDHDQMGSADHHQLSVQRWKDNKIVQEHHMYAV